ncbi:helix-turn-helix transcriptional regulator [Leucobacter allii]|uniref:Helix-turn-helix transcriptional regulator n=1 Tax=Leucobacter allii TaxID=2932247 RepID=A0ABY4FQM6_9MICO|nr:helix-turn-helix transcriptional regulator [Leucobacter allii]UOQ58593.1 helix-turn-helix transcriptional regulator [Leucobacter allii]
MQMNRTRYSDLDSLVSAEVRSEVARKRGPSISAIAANIGVRRASLSHRLNGHAPFTPSLLAAVAAELGTTAAEIISRAEEALDADSKIEMSLSAALAAEGDR